MPRSTPVRTLTTMFVAATMLLVAGCGGSAGDAKSADADPAVTTAATTEGEFSGYVRNPPADVSEVSLSTTEGDVVDMVAPEGGLLIVFFGYATCPDVCPLTLGVLRSAIENQPEAVDDRVDVAVITVDPSRDTDELLAGYVHGYDESWLALRTADMAELRAAADEFGASFTSRENMEGKREIAHSAELYVIDDTGTVILAWPYGVKPETITADLGRLLDGERPTVDG